MNEPKMPVLFVGHGSPMNAIEATEFSQTWEELGRKLPRPKAILAISAHWVSRGSRVNGSRNPKQIYDMYGFPPELYALSYACPGDPDLAKEIVRLTDKEVSLDDSWGIDHGVWSLLHWLYPKADIPVVEMNLDSTKTSFQHYELAKKLSSLREEGILILASGDVVHNLGELDWDKEGGYPWADAFDIWVRDKVLAREDRELLTLQDAPEGNEHAFISAEHYLPLLYALGASEGEKKVQVFNEKRIYGSLSMTGYLIGA
jgi:4,5-DOPA dioxygenase extradiol